VLPIRTAQDFIDRGWARRQRRRRAARDRDVLPRVLRLFVEHAGPVSRTALAQAVSHLTPSRLDRELARLDAQDLIVLTGDAVTMAYPFSGVATPFVVRLANGDERYSCCATDALGIAAMLGHRIDIRSRCHHCGEALALTADPSGPEPDGASMMVWVGRRADEDQRACTSL
jgi:hypothetical protein